MDKTLKKFGLRITHAQIDSEQIEQDLWEARQRITALEGEIERLREALEAVQWASTPFPAVSPTFCPWCGATEGVGHRSDCMRQAALEPAP